MNVVKFLLLMILCGSSSLVSAQEVVETASPSPPSQPSVQQKNTITPFHRIFVNKAMKLQSGYIKTQEQWKKFLNLCGSADVLPNANFKKNWIYIHVKSANDKNRESFRDTPQGVRFQGTLVAYTPSNIQMARCFLIDRKIDFGLPYSNPHVQAQSKAYFGMSVNLQEDSSLNTKTLVISSIEPGSPAMKAGLSVNDRIIAVDRSGFDSCETTQQGISLLSASMSPNSSSVKLKIAKGSQSSQISEMVVKPSLTTQK